MMGLNHKQRLNEAVLKDLDNYEVGCFITVNAFTKDVIKHEALVLTLSKWINFYCYGRAFRRGEKRLKIISASEFGTVNQGLHSHFMVMNNNDITKKIQQIEAFVHRKWPVLIDAKYKTNRFSNLVDCREIDNVAGCLDYITKTYKYQSNEYNLQYF